MAVPRPPRSILIVRPSALGDVCRTVPVLASLRRAFPEARLGWVVRDTFAAPIAAHPALDEVVPFPRSRFARWWRDPAVAREMAGWFAALRRRRYEVAFDCQGLGRSGLITWATGARRRIGFRSARELAWLGYNVRHGDGGAIHTVDAMLALVRAEGVEPELDLRLYLAEIDRLWWEERRAALGMADAPYAVLAPTARWESKRWPIERWRELAEALPDRGFDTAVVIGGPGESDQVRALTDGAPDGLRVVDLVAGTSIGQMMAVTAGAGLVVAHDSAPLHVAVGFDRPCVGLFGPTDPARVGPYGRAEAVARCAPERGDAEINYRDRRLGDDLMRRIPVEAALERVDAVMACAATPGAARCGDGAR